MAASGNSERLDILLVARGLIPTRSRARDLIKRGMVRVDGRIITKPAQLTARDADIQVQEGAGGYVSRGAVKLDYALEQFGFDAKERDCLDIGSSTGGFTQVLLERGAAHVTAVDVGRGQLAAQIRSDPRVTMLEETDARDLTRGLVSGPVTAIVADVSFISLTKALPVPLGLAAPGCWLVALIKPQFEVGPDGVGKGGIVREEAARIGAVENGKDWLTGLGGWEIVGVVASPIAGGSGNAEFLLGAVKE